VLWTVLQASLTDFTTCLPVKVPVKLTNLIICARWKSSIRLLHKRALGSVLRDLIRNKNYRQKKGASAGFEDENHPQVPPNLHPFVWRVYFNTCLLVRIPGLFCVRGMFKIFVGKNCRIRQLYWSFHQSICSKTQKRDLGNSQKGDTVGWALQNCMFLGGQQDIKRWACVWSRVV